MSWEPEQAAPDAGTREGQVNLKRYLAQRDGVVITRQMLRDLAGGNRDAQDAAYALLGTGRPFA